MTRIERAKQFMPFAALHGYEDLIRKQEFIFEARQELTEEESESLNKTVLALKKGDIVEVEFYATDGYVKIEGAITEINRDFRYIRIVKTKILFDNLKNIKKI